MMTFGVAACTPAQQTEFGGFLGNLITWILFLNVYGDPAPPQPPATTPTPPTTPPAAIGTPPAVP